MAGMQKRIARTLRRHGECTTIYPWAQIAIEKSVTVKLFWFIMLAAGLTLSGYHITKTVHKYMSTPVNTQVYDGAGEAVFPDVTICPGSIIPKHFAKYPDKSGMVKKLFKMYNSRTNMSEAEFLRVIYTSLDTNGLALPRKLFLYYCKYQNVDCKDSDFRTIRHPWKGSCFTYSAPKNAIFSGVTGGLTIIMYTAKTSIKIDDHYYLPYSSRKTPKTIEEAMFHYTSGFGALVDIHPPGSYPNFQSVIPANEGSILQLMFSMERHKLYSHRHRRCKPGKPKVKLLTHFTRNGTAITPYFNEYVWDRFLCRNEIIREELQKECGCDNSVSSHPHTTPADYCHYLPPYPTEEDVKQYNIRKTCEDSFMQAKFGDLYNDKRIAGAGPDLQAVWFGVSILGVWVRSKNKSKSGSVSSVYAK